MAIRVVRLKWFEKQKRSSAMPIVRENKRKINDVCRSAKLIQFGFRVALFRPLLPFQHLNNGIVDVFLNALTTNS